MMPVWEETRTQLTALFIFSVFLPNASFYVALFGKYAKLHFLSLFDEK